ncbi:hypothetical protein VTP01DRAFT_6549 [Rhizomucor pusillus]|uniref:uncharacterized protein n=1 Tax=Rhizomucor pusillus TaxID=4840 RepID=UPI0037444589
MWSRTRTLAADAKERCLKTFDSLPVLSFFLGFSGGTLAVFLGGYAMQEQLSRQCKEWRETMLSTRWRLEALGGVPYLLRDEEFISYWSQRHVLQDIRQSDNITKTLQHEWNQGIVTFAAILNKLLVKRYS